MKYFEFNNLVKICSGKNSIVNVKSELDFAGAKQPLILSDEGLNKAGTLRYVLKILSKNKVDTSCVWTEVPTDSSTQIIKRIAEFYKNNHCDSIVALGGGSVIDTAKGVKLLLSHNAENIMELSGNEILNKGEFVPFIVIPTTCGTGSECTSVAVIKNEETNEKMEFISASLMPDVAVLAPEVIETLPQKLVATTAIDAFTHAVEAFSCMQKNPVSDSFATAAIKLIAHNLLLSLNSPGKQEYKLNLLNASTLAGLAFSNSMVGIVHAIGHALGAFNVPHGNAMAILLPSCLQFNLDTASEHYDEMLLIFKGAEFYLNTNSEQRAKKFIEEVKTLITNAARIANFSLSLQDYGIRKENFEQIATLAINDGAAIINPKLFNKKDVINILEQCY